MKSIDIYGWGEYFVMIFLIRTRIHWNNIYFHKIIFHMKSTRKYIIKKSYTKIQLYQIKVSPVNFKQNKRRRIYVDICKETLIQILIAK